MAEPSCDVLVVGGFDGREWALKRTGSSIRLAGLLSWSLEDRLPNPLIIKQGDGG
jgi:hypothetical protein